MQQRTAKQKKIDQQAREFTFIFEAQLADAVQDLEVMPLDVAAARMGEGHILDL